MQKKLNEPEKPGITISNGWIGHQNFLYLRAFVHMSLIEITIS